MMMNDIHPIQLTGVSCFLGLVFGRGKKFSTKFRVHLKDELAKKKVGGGEAKPQGKAGQSLQLPFGGE